MSEARPLWTADVCLTLILPAAAEDRLVDWLLTHPHWPLEFSVHAVAARGPLVALAPGEEQVRGYAQRVEVKLLLNRSVLAPLVAELQALMAGVAGGFWVMPVESFQHFAAAVSPVSEL